jgi:hypothetical protein
MGSCNQGKHFAVRILVRYRRGRPDLSGFLRLGAHAVGRAVTWRLSVI